ncbi:thymidylate kinase [Nitrosococcus oceani ATCC 19707]|uniref:Thymidylate kinase n=1 Tax=Nitrosococcus oceani (strain ATCC 19707 / BCRC 17464 / JCM 30415 / NCIMB 11848 / C-107) TaxID=323261 RepID=Q3JAL4_NITOC|nr:thymidylate kinase [Nitrosococcus oceani ATCC 19707]
MLEGIEGAGKSTQLKFIQQLLQSTEKNVIVTREPGGTFLGEQIRELLLSPRLEGMSADTELLLMFAARVEHVQQVIFPALAAGKWVLCDRFTSASYAYQGGGRELPLSRIAKLESWALNCLRPDLILLFDVPVRLGLQRATTRCQQLDRFEQEKIDFFDRARTIYLSLAKKYPDQYRLIDSSLPLTRVQEAIQKVIMAFLEENRDA